MPRTKTPKSKVTKKKKLKTVEDKAGKLSLDAKKKNTGEIDTGYPTPPNIETLINWESKLDENDIYTDDDGNKFVPLASLEKLAALKGWKSQDCQINPIVINGFLYITAKYTVIWNDGTQSVGCGDAHRKNCEGNFALYLTTMAETRAYARALRRGLNISICAKEEIANDKTVEDLDDMTASSLAQVELIEKLLHENQMSFYDIVKEKNLDNVDSVSDLSLGQAAKFIKWLQDKKRRKIAKKNK